ncbi:ribonuclease H-like YkuK family protein [Paenibacillus agaridevorans]|uniref:ribonuclease H-like YkuK family protein n=1 Tax=Paenibacillus agaridevorans TaxID=171404 RepID=UPI000D59F629|nr:ribonuclease H-like YkuK family protein [Paenibacillus agaridevorans]
MKKKHYALLHETVFRNRTDRDMTLDEVFLRIVGFMKSDARSSYQLVIGTDAQVHAGHTKFITSIVIFRPGRGAWFCYRQVILPREIYSIQEKLTLETTFSQEIAAFFDAAKLSELEDILLPHVYQGAELSMYIDIDAGTDERRNQTAAFVSEMVGRVEAMGVSARVKPEAIVASSVSNRFTKTPHRGTCVNQSS